MYNKGTLGKIAIHVAGVKVEMDLGVSSSKTRMVL